MENQSQTQRSVGLTYVTVPLSTPGIITMTSKWARLRLKSPASRLFTQPFIQTEMKEKIKAPRHWPL